MFSYRNKFFVSHCDGEKAPLGASISTPAFSPSSSTGKASEIIEAPVSKVTFFAAAVAVFSLSKYSTFSSSYYTKTNFSNLPLSRCSFRYPESCQEGGYYSQKSPQE